MVVNNLLSLTRRTSVNLESEVLKAESVNTNSVNQNIYTDTQDNLTINGEIISLSGNLSDEEIFAIEDKISNGEVINVGVTSNNVTTSELNEIFVKNGISTSSPIILHRINIPNSTNTQTNDTLHKKVLHKKEQQTPTEQTLHRKQIIEKDVTLERKGNVNCINRSCGRLEIINLTLTNTFEGEDLYYTIQSNNNSNYSVKLEYLDNGRLLIIGDNLNITALKNQADDLIIIGNYNTIDTNSGNDRLRIGAVRDSYFDEEKQSNNNIVKTGSGNDYVQTYGFNTIDMEDGTNDSLLLISDTIENYNNESNLENYNNIYSDQYNKNEITQQKSDNILGWSMQNQYGDCKLLAFLNSLDNLYKYVTITKTNDVYNVYFKKSQQSIIVEDQDFDDEKNALGDIDAVIVEIAFRKLIADNEIPKDKYNINNNVDNYSLGLNTNNWLISKYFYGIKEARYVDKYINTTNGSMVNNEYESQVTILLNKYMSGEISNLIACTTGIDYGNNENKLKKLGIIIGHAYTVKEGEAGKYIKLINPHDSNDIIKLDWEDFIDYFGNITLYGDACNNAEINAFNNIGYNYYKDDNNVSVIEYHNYTGTATAAYTSDYENILDEIAKAEENITAMQDIIKVNRNIELYS